MHYSSNRMLHASLAAAAAVLALAATTESVADNSQQDLTDEQGRTEKQGLKAGQPSASRGEPPVFEAEVMPLLREHCGECHNPQSREADLDLTSLTGVLTGSESGEIVVPAKPDESLLYQMVESELMPPEGNEPLAEEQVALLRRWIAGGAVSRRDAAELQARQVTQHDVLPVMFLRCTVCHGLRRREADLDLRSRAGMLEGGKSGPAIVPGDPQASLLLKRIGAREMPPPKKLVEFGVRPVAPAEAKLIAAWIAAGAPEVQPEAGAESVDNDPLVSDSDRDFWSFKSPVRPTVPTVAHRELVRNPIDAFVLHRLEARGLSLSPEADKPTLIRRVVFDLTGLPPEWGEVERFLADESPRAYEKMVERVLDSRRYGERWARYWLDVAGYADSEGKRNADTVRPHAWRYRDYVIRAFNSDKPYDRFLLEQIAGDELIDYENAREITPEIYDSLVATGFLRMAPDGTGSDIVNTVVERMEVVSDEINVLGSAVLGLTVKCAQCHSHKYDPIPQRDYYRLVAVFQGAYDVYDWLKPSFKESQTTAKRPGRVLRHVPEFDRRAWQEEVARTEAEIAELESQLDAIRSRLARKHRAARLNELPSDVRDKVREALSIPAEQRDTAQQELATRYEKQLRIDEKTLRRLEPDYKNLAEKTLKAVRKLQADIPGEPAIRALWDRGVASPTYVFRRGDVTNPGDPVEPGVPAAITSDRVPFQIRPPAGSGKTGRRLALARWLVDPDHPLTARVMVNRLWRHHFGRGIVKTLDNFGESGSRPTHPWLLDWLAREFVARGWSVKEMHRLMIYSSTYRQSSRLTRNLEARDPENELFSRMPLRRMEAEVVRDSLLLASGRLDERPFGPPDPVKSRADGLVTSIGTEAGWRRSIYVQQRRKEIPTILENFNLPQMMPNCIDRRESIVASQALLLLNNSMIRQLARDFAERVQREAGSDAAARVDYIYRVALSRPPGAQERRLALETLARLTARWRQELSDDGAAQGSQAAQQAEQSALANLCHTVLNSAAFLYID